MSDEQKVKPTKKKQSNHRMPANQTETEGQTADRRRQTGGQTQTDR